MVSGSLLIMFIGMMSVRPFRMSGLFLFNLLESHVRVNVTYAVLKV